MNETPEAPSLPRASRIPAPTPVNGELRERVQNLRLGSGSGAGKSGFWQSVAWLPWVLCAVMAFTWGGVALRSYRNPSQSDNLLAPGGKTEQTQNQSKDSTGANIPSGTVIIEVKGYITPAQRVAVSPIDIGGQVIFLDCVEGKKYNKGHTLARIDASSYKASLEEAESALISARKRREAAKKRWEEQKPESVRPIEIEQVKAELAESKAQEQRAKQEMDRLDAARGSTAISTREYQQAQADYEAAKARTARLTATLDILIKGPRPERIAAAQADFDSAVADEQSAEARVRQAKWRYDNCEIKAPITGTILSKKAEQWNLVNPMAFGGTSGSICEMADLSDLEVDVEISERDIPKLIEGQDCTIKADAFPEKTFQGKLDRIMPIANRAKSVVNVRVKIISPAVELKPDMGAVVSFWKK